MLEYQASYYRPRNCYIEDEETLELMRLIDKGFLKHPFYGSRKMKAYLSRRGFPVNRKRFKRLMRLMGLESIAPKPNTNSQRKEHKVYPYLLKKM
jgi:putative transposase